MRIRCFSSHDLLEKLCSYAPFPICILSRKESLDALAFKGFVCAHGRDRGAALHRRRMLQQTETDSEGTERVALGQE